MSEGFSGSGASGDPVLLQHLIWLLGHPETWLSLFVWALCLAGAIKLGRLIRARCRSAWFVAYILSVLSFLSLYIFVLKQTFDTFVEGAALGESLRLLPVMSLVVNVLALASTIWIITDFLKRKRA